MSRHPIVLLLFLALTAPWRIAAQQHVSQALPTAPSQPEAVTILTQAIAAASGGNSRPAVQDFTGSGTITYYWAGTQVQGTVVVRGRGIDQFRVDATLPTGVRSWVVSYGTGTLKGADGTTTSIPYYNGRALRSQSFPLTLLLNAQQDGALGLSYIGSGALPTGQAYVNIRMQKAFPANVDPNGTQSHSTVRDMFIDPTSKMVLRVKDNIHPKDQISVDVPHEIDYADYRALNGIVAPFSITETVADQITWSMQLNQLSLNVGLTDSDFVL